MGLASYALLIAFVEIVVSQSALLNRSLAISSVSLAFDGISICMLYPVLTAKYFGESEVISRTFHSVTVLIFVLIAFLLNQRGILHLPRTIGH